MGFTACYLCRVECPPCFFFVRGDFLNYKTEYLGSGCKVAVSDEHSFGTDAVILADFARPNKNSVVCDMGTGCGIIPMLLYKNGYGKSIFGIEIQENAYEQAVESVKLSNAEDKVKIINGDIKNIKELFSHASFNTVIMNPPYKAAQGGIESKNDSARIARHEVMCNIDDVTFAAAHLLNFGGNLCLCNRPERLCDTIDSMRKAGIEPKRLRFVSKFYNTEPWLFLIEGKKGAKPFLRVEAPLAVYKEVNVYSDEMMEIYGEYKENVNG